MADRRTVNGRSPCRRRMRRHLVNFYKPLLKNRMDFVYVITNDIYSFNAEPLEEVKYE
jgi:hypothetical protein